MVLKINHTQISNFSTQQLHHFAEGNLKFKMDLKGTIATYLMNRGNITAEVTVSVNGSKSGQETEDLSAQRITQTLTTIIYITVCIFGLFGNGLVIYVVLWFSKMKTVTNVYIMNLALADAVFLLGVPFLVATSQLGHWPFGHVMCKLYMTSTSLTQFTSSMFLGVISFDRYFLLCHPFKSLQYRRIRLARFVCGGVWCCSLLANLPVILYARVKYNNSFPSCTIVWPGTWMAWSPDEAFVWYSFLFGFAAPVFLTLVFYGLIIRILKHDRPANASSEKDRSEKNVTKMVLTVITLYVICWSPYWVLQLALSQGAVHAFDYLTYVIALVYSLAYANSMINPFLYAFKSQSFRNSFIQAFKCFKRQPHYGEISKRNSRTSVTTSCM